MEEPVSQDHLSSSLTDLMTSLMVIFILLLLVFVQRTAGQDPAVAEELRQMLRNELTPKSFKDVAITRDRNVILVVVPNRLMNFKTGESTLKPEGEQFLRQYIPDFAEVVCRPKFRASVESIVVEGHTDKQPYPGLSPAESENRNLKLSQDRSMEVVKNALADLSANESDRACFLDKLSASGRGERDSEHLSDEESRRVILKIRVKVVDEKSTQVHVQ